MRRRKAKKITVLPDPRFQDAQVTKFVNNLMYDGKKSLAFKIFYDAIDIVEKDWRRSKKHWKMLLLLWKFVHAV